MLNQDKTSLEQSFCSCRLGLELAALSPLGGCSSFFGCKKLQSGQSRNFDSIFEHHNFKPWRYKEGVD